MDVEQIIQTKSFHSQQQRTVIHLLLVGNRISELVGQALKPFGVSMQQFNVLRILRGQKGTPSNLNTLNERMITRMSNTTRLVDKLLERGYVSRTVCASNRRKIEIMLTSAGSDVLSKMDTVVREVEHELMQNMTEEEMKTLNLLLNQIN
ncbi:MarR family transcriptional regulator [Robiginitalea sp.]|nr:MarR family transcriptional regulator [Robiginitalea sp.]